MMRASHTPLIKPLVDHQMASSTKVIAMPTQNPPMSNRFISITSLNRSCYVSLLLRRKTKKSGHPCSVTEDLHETVENRLLAALPRKEYQRLVPHLRSVPLDLGQVIHEADEPIRHVYFPNHGVVSILNTLGERMSIEVGTIGQEGMAGITSSWELTCHPTAPWCRFQATP